MPLPVPVVVTVRVKSGVKLAVTVVFPVIVKEQVATALTHPPLNPVKAEPCEALAVRVIEVPLAKEAIQVAPQLIPPGLLLTLPLPSSARVTVRVKRGAKVAVQVLLAFMVTSPSKQSASPLQPTKVEPLSATAARLTMVPLG